MLAVDRSVDEAVRLRPRPAVVAEREAKVRCRTDHDVGDLHFSLTRYPV